MQTVDGLVAIYQSTWGAIAVKRLVVGAFLEKVARHLMLLSCMAILSNAAGWTATRPTSILLLIMIASAAHLSGRAIGGIPKGGRRHDP